MTTTPRTVHHFTAKELTGRHAEGFRCKGCGQVRRTYNGTDPALCTTCRPVRSGWYFWALDGDAVVLRGPFASQAEAEAAPELEPAGLAPADPHPLGCACDTCYAAFRKRWATLSETQARKVFEAGAAVVQAHTRKRTPRAADAEDEETNDGQ